MSERTVEEIVAQAQYARTHAEGALALPSVLVGWVKDLADDVEALAARRESNNAL